MYIIACRTNLSNVMTVPAETIARSSAAERMRLHRERRRNGMRSLWVELRVTEIDALVRTGLLKVETKRNPRSLVWISRPNIGTSGVTRNREPESKTSFACKKVAGDHLHVPGQVPRFACLFCVPPFRVMSSRRALVFDHEAEADMPNIPARLLLMTRRGRSGR